MISPDFKFIQFGFFKPFTTWKSKKPKLKSGTYGVSPKSKSNLTRQPLPPYFPTAPLYNQPKQ